MIAVARASPSEQMRDGHSRRIITRIGSYDDAPGFGRRTGQNTRRFPERRLPNIVLWNFIADVHAPHHAFY